MTRSKRPKWLHRRTRLSGANVVRWSRISWTRYWDAANRRSARPICCRHWPPWRRCVAWTRRGSCRGRIRRQKKFSFCAIRLRVLSRTFHPSLRHRINRPCPSKKAKRRRHNNAAAAGSGPVPNQVLHEFPQMNFFRNIFVYVSIVLRRIFF